MASDPILKLYFETLKSPYLHYGFWDHPAEVTLDTFQLKDMVAAQQRYIEHVCSFIPKDVRHVLDVGCGLGGNAAFLRNQGYDVDLLTPDEYQATMISQKFLGALNCYQCRFEDFQSPELYDLILESESACYIEMKRGFEVAHQTLRSGGYVLVSDYFIHFQDKSGNPHLRSSHLLSAYLDHAKKSGFHLVKEFDQTENTMPTLNLAHELTHRFFKPLASHVAKAFERRHPLVFTLGQKLFSKKITKKEKELALIDSNEFRKYRKYMVLLFQKV